MKKKKLVKILAAGGLAIFMGVGTLCGVLLVPMNSALANTGATASSNSTNLAGAAQLGDDALSPQDKLVAGEGIINPQETDPVVFTTVFGLDIKWGNGGVSSGSLKGFPYFITNDGSKSYTWVVVGLPSTTNTSGNVILNPAINYSNCVGEQNSPAALKIIQEDAMHLFCSSFAGSTNKPKTNSDVLAGHVLVLANEVITSGVKNTSSRGTASWVSTNYNYHSTYVGDLASTLEGYYTNSLLGLGQIKKYIPNVSLTTYGYTGSSVYNGGNKFTGGDVVSSHHVFTLGGTDTDTFYYLDYLTDAQAKISSSWWLRGCNEHSTQSGTVSGNSAYFASCHVITTDGALSMQYSNTTAGYRPAFCLKLI